MAASISLQQDRIGGAPGSKKAEEFQEGQQELQGTLNLPHPLFLDPKPSQGGGGIRGINGVFIPPWAIYSPLSFLEVQGYCLSSFQHAFT